MHPMTPCQRPDRQSLPIMIPADRLQQLHSETHPFCDLQSVLEKTRTVQSRSDGSGAKSGRRSQLSLKRLCDLLVAEAEGQQRLLDGIEVGEVVGLQHLALDDREVDLAWLSQLACTGVWTRMRFFQAPCSRLIDRLPRCAEPLSTITNTRWALL